MIVAPGSTSVSVDVFFSDDTGAAVTGKVAADFPACKWSGGGNVASTAITLSDLTAITTAHPNDNTAGGVKEREGGWYRLDLPNNMFTSAGRKTLTFAETTNKRILAPTFDVQYIQGDVRQVVGSPSGVTEFSRATQSIVTGVVGSGSTTTSIVLSSVSVSAGAADCWKGLVIKFPNNTTTTALRGQGGIISANTSGATPTLTLANALTTAPVSGDLIVLQ